MNHREIYLTKHGGGVYWEKEKVGKDDTKYIREDIVKQAIRKEKEKTDKIYRRYLKIKKQLEEMQDQAAYVSMEL